MLKSSVWQNYRHIPSNLPFRCLDILWQEASMSVSVMPEMHVDMNCILKRSNAPAAILPAASTCRDHQMKYATNWDKYTNIVQRNVKQPQYFNMSFYNLCNLHSTDISFSAHMHFMHQVVTHMPDCYYNIYILDNIYITYDKVSFEF